jgi:hypothetical protein
MDVNALPPAMRHTAEIYLCRPKTARNSKPASAGASGAQQHHTVSKEPYTTKSSLLRTEFVRRRLELMKMEEALEEEKRIKVGTFIEYPGYKPANEYYSDTDGEESEPVSQRSTRPQSADVSGRRARKESVENSKFLIST